MSLIAYILLLALSGLIVGALARLALPGPDPMSIWATIALGLAGSFIAGLAVRLIDDDATAPGIILSVLVSTLLLWGLRRSRGRGVTPYNSRR